MDDEQTAVIEDTTLNNQIEDVFDPNLVIDDAPNPYEQIERSDNIRHLMLVFNTQLSENQKKIIFLKFGFKNKPMTFREVSRKLNIAMNLVVEYYNDAITIIKYNWDHNVM